MARAADAAGRAVMQESAVQQSGAPTNGSVDPEREKVEQLLRDAEIETVLGELDEQLVALTPVKTRIREIAALLLVDRLRRELELSSNRPTLHMSFTGNPGTGKTTVAMKVADILHRLGYIDKNKVVAVTRDDLVGQYVGHTAPKTKEVLKRASGGVLFIDEAYYLYRPENERDYGVEAIEILLQVMENERENLVVVLAGYKDRMDNFFRSNPGMSSRVAHHIDFPDYTVDELVLIAQMMVKQEQYELGPEAEEALRAYLERRMQQPLFAHARSVRNAIERARLRHANRVYQATLDGKMPTREDLVRIESEDFLKSTVFGLDRHDDDTPPPDAQSAPA
ncbi:MAG TPA: CbbX protein [Solirubrobacteraceae bacterium]|jgi:probable Rubsico expression protein CbbX|nr:CbbX protein [Solirubrobacteraceae bacterium]